MGLLVLCFILSTDLHGVWVPRWSIKDGNDIFDNLDNRFNHIFLQVYALGEAYYPSKYAPSKKRSDQWLIAFLDEAHRRNIRVSAWINVFYAWGFAQKSNKWHPIIRQPNWFVRDQENRSIVDYSIEELKQINCEGYYFAPANPQVRAYLANIALEIVEQYDFDGIHFDYIRYPNSGFVYDTDLRSKFMRYYFIDPLELSKEDEFGIRFGLWGYDDISGKWGEFIRYDLTSYVEYLNKLLKAARPELLISAAVKPNYQSAYRDFDQDWLFWLNAGYLDFVCLMAYGKHIKSNLKDVMKAVNNPSQVTVGLGLYILSPEEISEQVDYIRGTDFSGIVFYSYDQVKENRRYLDALEN
jgi:uncharacterized lipoprotein YddW (UPF0748 family)